MPWHGGILFLFTTLPHGFPQLRFICRQLLPRHQKCRPWDRHGISAATRPGISCVSCTSPIQFIQCGHRTGSCLRPELVRQALGSVVVDALPSRYSTTRSTRGSRPDRFSDPRSCCAAVRGLDGSLSLHVAVDGGAQSMLQLRSRPTYRKTLRPQGVLAGLDRIRAAERPEILDIRHPLPDRPIVPVLPRRVPGCGKSAAHVPPTALTGTCSAASLPRTPEGTRHGRDPPR